MAKRIKRRPVSILGVGLDLGAGRRGTDAGPTAVRLAGLRAELTRAGFKDVEDLGNVDAPAEEKAEVGDPKAKYLDAIAATCRKVAREVRDAMKRGRVPVVIGGDHSCAIGTISGVVAYHRSERKQTGVIWVDAHGDMNTPETSGSGNVHGMPLAACLGLGPEAITTIGGRAPKLTPDRVALVGIRDLDYKEREVIVASGVNVFTMADIDERGMAAVMRDAIAIAKGPDGDGPYHVSFDLDGVDPEHAPGVGTAVPGGLTFREAHLAMELVALDGGMSSVEMTEINPFLDIGNRTGRLAMDLILSALGKRIYRR
jgi:arginase